MEPFIPGGNVVVSTPTGLGCSRPIMEDGTTRTYTLARKYVSKEQHNTYMKAYLKKRYHNDPVFRQNQLEKAKQRYQARKKNEMDFVAEDKIQQQDNDNNIKQKH